MHKGGCARMGVVCMHMEWCVWIVEWERDSAVYSVRPCYEDEPH